MFCLAAKSLTSRTITENRFMNISFKIHFMLFVLTLHVGFIFIEEIQPCQFEIQNFFMTSSVKLQNLS